MCRQERHGSQRLQSGAADSHGWKLAQLQQACDEHAAVLNQCIGGIAHQRLECLERGAQQRRTGRVERLKQQRQARVQLCHEHLAVMHESGANEDCGKGGGKDCEKTQDSRAWE